MLWKHKKTCLFGSDSSKNHNTWPFCFFDNILIKFSAVHHTPPLEGTKDKSGRERRTRDAELEKPPYSCRSVHWWRSGVVFLSPSAPLTWPSPSVSSPVRHHSCSETGLTPPPARMASAWPGAAWWSRKWRGLQRQTDTETDTSIKSSPGPAAGQTDRLDGCRSVRLVKLPLEG